VTPSRSHIRKAPDGVLFNAERARELLRRDGLDGLVAARPINQYYLSGYWGLFNTPVGYDAAYFAVFAANEAEPAALIVPALEIRRIETDGGTWMPNLFAYSSPAECGDFADGTPRGADHAGWPFDPDATLTEIEMRWRGIIDQFRTRMSPDAFWAVSRALRAAGLERGTVAVDDVRLGGWLAACGHDDLDCRYLPGLFNEIRLVKTPDEIDLLRTAARINEQALFSAVEALGVGVTWNELEDRYMAAMAREGGRGVYLMGGVGGLPAGTARAGEPIMFDALGQYRRYHGDFGRCAVIGEAGERQLAYHRAICNGWSAALDKIRPGIRYSELSRQVGDVVRRSGITGFRDPIVHSLGLEHTDDVKPPGVQPQSKPDRTLEANMVINIDMPHTEIGWGSVHSEDTVLVTPGGPEPLTSQNMDLRVVACSK